MSRCTPISPWHFTVYDDIHRWPDEKVRATYRRLSMDLRRGERDTDDLQHVTRMIEAETELAERGIDPREIAKEVETELGR